MSALVAEALFGMAPFASKTFEELQDKILDQRQIEVRMWCECINTVWGVDGALSVLAVAYATGTFFSIVTIFSLLSSNLILM